MISLCVVKVGPRKWVVTTTELCWKYVCEIPPVPVPEVLKQEQAMQNWIEDVGLKKEGGSE